MPQLNSLNSEHPSQTKGFPLETLDISPQILIRLPAFIRRLRIAQKITAGYVLAIGIAMLGATAGVVIGDQYQRLAQQQLIVARQQKDLLNTLEKEVLAMRSHPQRLMMVFGDSIWFDFERAKFLTHVTQVKRLSKDLETFRQQYSPHLTVSVTHYDTLFQGYQTTSDAYAQWIQTFWQAVEPGNLNTKDILLAQQRLLKELKSRQIAALEVKFERLTERLQQISQAAETQEIHADEQLRNAEILRLQIIALSMVWAMLIAIVLAIYISRTIARPVEAVTQVAQQVTQQSNFSLRAPLLTDDEVGVMANAFNKLIQRVADYTQELEESRQTLEIRVEERTQDLRQALENFQKAQTQLVQAEKMSSLGQLVAGIAHEINNPVNFIHGNLTHLDQYTRDLLELLQLYNVQVPKPSADIQEKMDEIEMDFLKEDLPKVLDSLKVGTERIQGIIKSLRNFSRLDEAEIKQVDIHEGLDSTLLILRSRLKAKTDHPDIEIIQDYGELPKIECYAGQLNQVFMNILANAIDALDESMQSYSHQPLEKPTNWSPQIRIRTEVLPDDRVAIHIIDNGPGIPEEAQKRLFDPFFTTKPIGKGTGLGMSISYQIVVEKHGGVLRFNSKPGQGTDFIVEIPIYGLVRQSSPTQVGT